MDHNHTSCCHNHQSKNQTETAKKWLFSLGFVLVLILLTKPFIADQLIQRADAYYCFGLYDDAIRQYKKAILLTRANSAIWVSLGDSFLAEEEFDKAIEAFREAIKIAPEDRAANFNLGMVFTIKKDYKSAIVYFEKVRSLGAEPREQLLGSGFSCYSSSLKMLATCFEKLHELEKAAIVQEEFKQACRSETLALKK